MDLTEAHQRARQKLTRQWQSAEALGESLPTLEDLVRRGQAAIERGPASSKFPPRATIKYKLPTKQQ